MTAHQPQSSDSFGVILFYFFLLLLRLAVGIQIEVVLKSELVLGVGSAVVEVINHTLIDPLADIYHFTLVHFGELAIVGELVDVEFELKPADVFLNCSLKVLVLTYVSYGVFFKFECEPLVLLVENQIHQGAIEHYCAGLGILGFFMFLFLALLI